jgi:hypothetical protein
MAAVPSEQKIELRHVRGWGRVIAALSAQLAKSPHDPLGETMVSACDKLLACWQRVQAARKGGRA